jgi:hypothetical protein
MSKVETHGRGAMAALGALGVMACGGVSAEGAPPLEAVGGDAAALDGGAAPPDAKTERCAMLLDQDGLAYPARWARSSAELGEFERHSDRFREHYGRAATLYSVEPKAATVSPDIALLRPNGTVPAIQLAREPLSVDVMTSGTDAFVARWQELLNPYQVELVGQAPTEPRDQYVQRDFLQSYCGLPVRYGDQHEYNGRLHFTAYRETSTILFAYSSVVPLVPLPPARFAAEDVLSVLTDQPLVKACGEPKTIPSSACLSSEARRVVFVAPDGDGITYRLAYEVSLQAAACAADAETWTVFVDAVDGTIVHSSSDRACPPAD